MVRTKKSQPEPASPAATKATRTSSRKRPRDDDQDVVEGHPAPAHDTPTKRRGRAAPSKPAQPSNNAALASAYDFPGSDQDEADAQPEPLPETPSKKARGRPKTTSVSKPSSTKTTPRRQPSDEHSSSDELAAEQQVSASPTKKAKRRPAVADEPEQSNTPKGRKTKEAAAETPVKSTPVKSTPLKARSAANGETPRWRRNDRSARKKSARALIEKVVNGDASDEDDDLAREIYETSDEENDENEQALNVEAEVAQAEVEAEAAPATPSKRPRGRPRKTDSARTRKKSPTPPRDLPPHELYFAQNRPGSTKTSDNNLSSLKLLTHDEYFSILHEHRDSHAEDMQFLESIHLESFPQWAFELSEGFSVCLYGFGSKRAVLHKYAKHLFDMIQDHNKHRIVVLNGYVRASSLREILNMVAGAVDRSHKLPAGTLSVMFDSIKELLSTSDTQLTILVNSLDAAPLRRPGAQSVLSQLASLPEVQLIGSVDTPDFAMLWDSGLRSAFNFAFHNVTTFAPFDAELDVVDDVHDLLGRKARRVGGKEGAIFVLRSLTENARNLFRLLVGEVLVLAEDDGGGESAGVEYRMLYNKAVEEFICSSEMAYRGLLKEFYDHQIITSRKDVLGTELLSIPFQKEELEAILEDLMS